MNKIKKIFSGAVVSITLGCLSGTFTNLSFATPPVLDYTYVSCDQMNAYGKPQTQYKLQYICHNGYSVGYNIASKTPLWVSEYLTRENLDTKTSFRSNKFVKDPKVIAKYSATLKDYSGSGYDRGHMAAAENFRKSQLLMDESFYLSNIIPQNSNNNQGIWAKLEKNTRYWAQKYEAVYIVTGAFYYQHNTAGNAGSVLIPTHLYKAIYIPKLNEAVAFVMPNEALDIKDLPKYSTSIKELEQMSNITFVPNLNDDVKSKKPNNLFIFDK